MEKQKELNKPVDKFRGGQMTATVWKKLIEINGKDVEVFSVKITKSYKDDKGEWHDTDNYGTNDIPKLIIVAQEAYKSIVLREKETA